MTEPAALSDTADHLQALTKARAQPHVLDDATIDRMERVHREQLQFVDIYAEQLRRPSVPPRNAKVRIMHWRASR